MISLLALALKPEQVLKTNPGVWVEEKRGCGEIALLGILMESLNYWA